MAVFHRPRFPALCGARPDERESSPYTDCFRPVHGTCSRAKTAANHGVRRTARSRRSGFWPLGHCSSAAGLELAKDKATRGLAQVSRGLQDLAEANLPQEAGSKLAVMCNVLRELEQILQTAQVQVPTCGSAHPSLQDLQEKLEWERLCPGSGQLVRTLTCVAPSPARTEELFAGRLRVSSVGLCFEGKGGGAELLEEILQSRFLCWADIAKVTAARGIPTNLKETGPVEVVIMLGHRDLVPVFGLRCFVSGSEDFDLLRQTWLTYGGAESGSALSAENCSRSSNSLELSSPSDSSSALSGGPSAGSLGGEVSSTGAEDDLPLQEHPSRGEPVVSAVLPNVALSQITRILLQNEDWLFERFLNAQYGTYDIEPSEWKEAGSSKSLVRTLRGRIPFPPDVPKAIVRMLALPPSSRVTMVFRAEIKQSEVRISQETCTHDVAFGESFKVQDLLVFKPDPSGGVAFLKWTVVKWEQALPWSCSIIKPFVERKTRSGSIDGGKTFLRILQEGI